MDYDFIAIGGGSAGYAGARTARQFTDKVALVDGAEELGGLCILRGCMPSKTLLYAGEVLHAAKHGKTLGLDIPHASANMPEVIARKRRIIADFAQYRTEQLVKGDFNLYRSHARFRGDHTIELDDGSVLRGRKILVATGSKINIPPVPGLESASLWTSDEVLDLDFVPESVIVLGAGSVGCELAQYLSRIGSRVTLIQRSPHVLKDNSPEAGQTVERAFREEGIEVFTGTQIRSVKAVADGVEVEFDWGNEVVVRKARYGLNALGRIPNTAGLNLEDAHVDTSHNGRILTNGFQQTSNPDIYAAGDCSSRYEIVHVGIQQGETAALHAMGKEPPEWKDDLILSVVFTDPQVTFAGARESDLTSKGIPYLAASYPYNDHGKAILMEAHHGYVKVLASREEGRVLGAEIVGKDAGELIHIFSVALTMGATVFDLLKAPLYHPTLAEIISYPLEEIAEKIGSR